MKGLPGTLGGAKGSSMEPEGGGIVWNCMELGSGARVEGQDGVRG